MNILIIADSLQSLDEKQDSTLHLVRVAVAKYKATPYYTVPENVFVENGRFYANVDGRNFELAYFHSIHFRKDPPVDLKFMRFLSLMQSSPYAEVMINHPSGMLLWNEKYSTMKYPKWSIPSSIVNSRTEFQRICSENTGKKLILKPSAEAASRGIQTITADGSGATIAAYDKINPRGEDWVIVQEYDDSIQLSGETRAFILFGKVAGALKKTLSTGQSVMDFDSEVRSKLSLTALSEEQLNRATEIAKDLQQDGIFCATIDFISDRILEINVTSPGLLKWVDEQPETLDKLAEIYWKNVFTQP